MTEPYILRARREFAGLTVPQAAALCTPPVTPRTWRRWEHDDRAPPTAIAALARAGEAPPRSHGGKPARTNGRNKRQIVLGDEAAAWLDRQPDKGRSNWIEGLILAAKATAEAPSKPPSGHGERLTAGRSRKF